MHTVKIKTEMLFWDQSLFMSFKKNDKFFLMITGICLVKLFQRKQKKTSEWMKPFIFTSKQSFIPLNMSDFLQYLIYVFHVLGSG